MKKRLMILTLAVAVLILSSVNPALAACSTHTYWLNGRMVMCQTCCFGNNCTTTCF